MTKEDVYGGSFTAFPAGLRVLVVDNDFSSLSCLAGLLEACHYRVTPRCSGVDALSLLRKKEIEFDIVIHDIFMSDMDGFRFLEIIQLEMMDVPVVTISNNNSRDIVLKAINMGACGYLVKPVRKEEISVIWQHIVRRNSKTLLPPSEINHNKKKSSTGEENCGSSSFHVRNDEEVRSKFLSKKDIVSSKKQRMVWTAQLHEQFVAVVNSIGLKNAVPKKILELMKVPDLTRENVASHLQKYRMYLRKRPEKRGKRPRNIPSAQAQNIMHPSMMGSSTSASLQAAAAAAYPPPMSNQLYSQASVVSQADIDEAEIFSAGGGYINGVPITCYTHQPQGYGLQPPPPTAAIQETVPEFIGREQSLNDDDRTIQISLPISSVGQSNNHHLQQQQQLGGYNLFNYDGCAPDATDQYASYATVGNNLQPEHTFPFYDSFYLLQHYDDNQEGLNAHSQNIPYI